MKINLLVMFGGVSCEHDISIITALQAIKFLDEEKYNIIPIFISKTGEWYTGKRLLDISFFKNKESPNLKKLTKVTILPNDNYLYRKTKMGVFKIVQVDVALLSFHGANGEDGSISALFELNQIPYTAASLFGSSLCCDKVNFKYYIKGLGLKSAKFITLNQTEFETNSEDSIKEIEDYLGYPLIVKPSKLGSSIGITMCSNKKELLDAIDLGLSLDDQVLIEEFLINIREINCAIIGFGKDIIVSELEEPIKTSKILSFENKYINTKKNGDMQYIARNMPPKIEQETYDEVVRISELLFSKLRLKGIIRIDYILTKENKVLVNEINTIPGSFANYLFKPKYISYTKLLNKLITTAINENLFKQQKIKTFNSDVLSNIDLNASGMKK